MTPDGLLLLAAYGTACYVLGLVTGARLIPWLVDRYDVSTAVLVPLLLTVAGLLSVDLPRLRP
jgi:hypothetical protein